MINKLFDFDMLLSNHILIKLLYVVLMLVVLGLQIYLLMVELPENRAIFNECNQKIMCENGLLYGDICLGYEKFVNNTLVFNFTIGN